MKPIASPHNPRLKSLRQLQTRRGRERSGRFLAEGEDLVAAAQRAGRPALDGYRLTGSELGGRKFRDVETSALAAVSTLGSGTRVIGVYEQHWSAPAGPLCVYLHGVGDPGNVGTVLRSAWAFGASCVALGPRCADPHAPKAVRASMGAIFAVALARVTDVRELPGQRVALVAHGGEPLPSLGARLASAPAVSLLVGAERAGLPPDVLASSDRVARIPIRTDSLNAAIATSVALYELARSGAGESSDAQRFRVRAS
jgi:RNA methyltransferase, TrmH family